MLANSDLISINGGCFIIYKAFRFVKIHIKHIFVRYFI